MVAALLVGALPGAAAEAESPEALIRQGNDLRRRGDNARAYGYFERAYELTKIPRTAAQLGLASQAVGKVVQAEELLSLALAKGDPWVDSNRATLEASLRKIREDMGGIAVVGAPPGTKVEIADRPARSLPADGVVWSRPGNVVVVVDIPGGKPVEKTVVVALGRLAEVVVEAPAPSKQEPKAEPEPPRPSQSLSPAGETSPALPPPRSASPNGEHRDVGQARYWSWQRTAGLVTGSLAAGSLAAGVAYSVARSDITQDFNDGKCTNAGGSIDGPAFCWSFHDDSAYARDVAITTFAGAALLGTASVLSFALAPDTSARGGAARGAGIGLIVTGVGALSMGLVFQILRSDHVDRFNRAGCTSSTEGVAGPGVCHSIHDHSQSASNLALAGYAGGALLGGAGTLLLVLGGGDGASHHAAAGASIGCAPSAVGDVGAACMGRF